MTKRLVDIDDRALSKAQAELGTATIKDTVNEALKRAGATREASTRSALENLQSFEFVDRDDLWR